METLQNLLPTVPKLACSYPTYEEWKLCYSPTKDFFISTCSYPTYEEWKQRGDRMRDLLQLSSYPTYEEWKLVKLSMLTIESPSSYPTYEEWKQFLISSSVTPSNIVLILPMRNGNQIFLRHLLL